MALHRIEDHLESRMTWAEQQLSRTIYGYKSRVERLRSALADSRTIAWRAIVLKLEGIDMSMIWEILYSALHDIALYYGGTVVLGTAIGAGAGALAGGIGAVPGAAIGMAAGAQLGGWVLTFLGLEMVAKGLTETIPQAMACYVDGFRAAWGSDTQERDGRPAMNPAASEKLAAHRFADGHVLMVVGMLIALLFYLTKGGSEEALLLKAVRGSRRLGPKVADWLEKNKEILKNHPALQPKARRLPEQEELPSRQSRQSSNAPRAAGQGGGDPKAVAGAPKAGKVTVFSGHGAYYPQNRTVVVPDGTQVTFYSAHGATITDDLGNAIETGQDVSNVFQRTYGPGSVVPNYTLSAPNGLNIMGNPVTVTEPTNLSELLQPGMGKVCWAACTYNPDAAGGNLRFSRDGIFDKSTQQYTTLYDE
ncbi:DUF6861 domain-containing protein [Dyella choica]|uniref:Uncharacterized protein n=1 Tax=Dyella choica TaxID=1927959 RepID=A0A3S0PGR1_9GAMM|nr:hypothetical protein [Dyella choica]RUL72506.1 hypothetical protein EKH80_17665 [Dyella choica]